MFDRPGLVLLVLLATFAPLTAHAIVKSMNNWRSPTGADAVLSVITELFADCLVALLVSGEFAARYDEHKRMIANDEPGHKRSWTPNEPIEQRPRTLLDMNRADGYAMNVQAVKIDTRRHFAITQWRTYEYYGRDAKKLDWTEGYWLKSKPRRWKGKNDEFRQMMHEIDGTVIEKADPERPNSGYILRDETMLHRMASGYLPH